MAGLTWGEVALHNRYVRDLDETHANGQVVINYVARQRDRALRDAAALRREVETLRLAEGKRRLANIRTLRAARGL